MMTPITKSHNYECCMCGDHGLPLQLFRCSVCHFRSQHRYCSNLYPKAETYRVCNWCLIQKDNFDDHENLTITSYNNSSISSSPEDHAKTNYNKKLIINNNNHQTGASPMKKPIRSPSGRKGITASTGLDQAQQEETIRSSSILRRTKSTEAISSSINKKKKKSGNSKKSESGGCGGPTVIKHVYRNKVRRYKLLDEVSC